MEHIAFALCELTRLSNDLLPFKSDDPDHVVSVRASWLRVQTLLLFQYLLLDLPDERFELL